MNLHLIYIFLSLAVNGAASSPLSDTVIPYRVSQQSLLEKNLDSLDPEFLVNAVSSEGFVSITDIPGFKEVKRDTLKYLHACLMKQDDGVFPEQIFKDGTIRRTIGTVTIPGDGQNQRNHKPIKWAKRDEDIISKELPASCQLFSENLDTFRSIVDDTTAAFSKRLSLEIKPYQSPLPFMSTEDGSHSFDEFKDIVAAGEHLEHFHSYQKPIDTSSSDSSSSLTTIDLHVDQGLFIVFSPGLMVSHTESVELDQFEPIVESDEFHVESSNGNLSRVLFDASDDLVFLMGDGVDQYINPNLLENPKLGDWKLRATPHALLLKTHDASLARVWYGRMILPPKKALISSSGYTHGEVRHFLTTLPDSERRGGLGCSSNTMRALEQDTVDVKDDNSVSCDFGSIYCWARCMELESYNLTESMCAVQNLDLKCINPREQFSDGREHGDFYPACSNSTEVSSYYPPLPDFPQDIETCSTDEWEIFSSSEMYDFTFNLTTDSTSAKFHWTVKENGIVAGKLVFNGLFGWLSLGLLNLEEGAGHNGMNGANVILALPGDNYNAKDGLDLNLENNVREYTITDGSVGSSFRHWQTPLDSNTEAGTVDYDGCFTSLSFESDNIMGEAFDIEGKNHLLWAGNTLDYYVGYHLSNRAIFTVEWNDGVAYFGKELQIDVPNQDDERLDDNISSSASLQSGTNLVALIVSGLIYFLLNA